MAGLAVNLTEAHPIVSLHFGELADAPVQVASIRPAFSQHLFRRPQQQLTHPGNGIIITSSITNETIDELALAVGDDAIGAYSLRGGLDKAKSALSESIRLKPPIKSLARMRAENRWLTDPRYEALQANTLDVGLRHAGFPDQ